MTYDHVLCVKSGESNIGISVGNIEKKSDIGIFEDTSYILIFCFFTRDINLGQFLLGGREGGFTGSYWVSGSA